jgi:glycosyltransferase involved in cell wall biosynthesis
MTSSTEERLTGGGFRLGFACAWAPDERETWSGTPWRLRQELAKLVQVEDLGVTLGASTRAALKAIHVRPTSTGLVSNWQHSPLTDRVFSRVLHGNAASIRPDAVLQVQDLARFEEPYYTYQDLSYASLLGLLDAGVDLTHFPGLARRQIERRCRRQLRIYAAATGVVAMSHWLARCLEEAGVPSGRIHVVHPGINTDDVMTATAVSRAGQRGRPQAPTTLVFVGRDFFSKGGDLVVHALGLLRDDYDPHMRLTLIGPKVWPLPDAPAAGVDYLGSQSRSAVGHHLQRADLFVMPSRFEGFGIAFAEALVAGTPVVGRRAFAMPEIIEDGVNGALVDSDDPGKLAEKIVACLEDDTMTERVRQGRAAAAERWSWSRAAQEMVHVVAGSSA